VLREIIKSKGKRGWKRKSAALEADGPEPEAELEVARGAKEVIDGRGNVVGSVRVLRRR
jgi:hypothetical protein